MRRAAVLLPLFSIRSGGGLGVGEIADLPRLARWARAAGFGIVQLLPVNEVCGGETSPYAAASAFALDPVYLSLDECEDFHAAGGRGLLSPAERQEAERLAEAPRVPWAAVRALKERLARAAFDRFAREEWARQSGRAAALRRFSEEHAAWLDDWVLFAALHDRFRAGWLDWPAPLRDREPEALARAREAHAADCRYEAWLQWVLDVQWRRARADARAAGVELMGDLPFVVAADSADVWARRREFRLDARVGAPPDAFSSEGQDWGLPLYDWTAMEASGFAWMRARAARAADLFALYRVDHVIGLYRTWYREPGRPEGAFSPATEDAQLRLGETLIGILGGGGRVVAEDLGMVPPFLRDSLTRLGVPGYRVLRWERDERRTGDGAVVYEYRDPAGWPVLSVAASGTHDTDMLADWWDRLPSGERQALLRIPGLAHLAADRAFDAGVRDALLRVLYAAPSELVALPFQDVLGSRERINVPGTVDEANWSYRMPMTVADLEADRETTGRLAGLAADTDRIIA